MGREPSSTSNPLPCTEAVLANVREEIREEVAYALELAAAQSSGEQCCSQDGKGPVRALSATDTIYTLPQPSDATELVEALRFIANLPHCVGEPAYALQYYGQARRAAIDALNARPRAEAADFITQAQARATAAEGDLESLRVSFANRGELNEMCPFPLWMEIVCSFDNERKAHEAAQQTITQLTRELETARKVLEPFVTAAARLERDTRMSVDGGKTWPPLPGSEWVPQITLKQCRAAASFLSSLSHQDEQG